MQAHEKLRVLAVSACLAAGSLLLSACAGETDPLPESSSRKLDGVGPPTPGTQAPDNAEPGVLGLEQPEESVRNGHFFKKITGSVIKRSQIVEAYCSYRDENKLLVTRTTLFYRKHQKSYFNSTIYHGGVCDNNQIDPREVPKLVKLI
jgi:hypothetical protein